jgi:hypothetical protein
MERCTIATILCVELDIFTAFLFLPFAIRLLSQYQNNVYPSCALWIKFLIHLMWLLFHSNKCSRAFLSATITPIRSSGYQNNYGLPGNTWGLQDYYKGVVYYNSHRELWLSAYRSLLGNTQGCRFFLKSLKEHASDTFDENLLTKTIPPILKKHVSAAIDGNNAKYDRLTLVHCVTKPNKRIVPSFTRRLSPLRTYVRPNQNCDYYRVIVWANWPGPSVAFDRIKNFDWAYSSSTRYDVKKEHQRHKGVVKEHHLYNASTS